MIALNVSIPASELGKRMQERLRQPATGTPAAVVWQKGSNRAVIHLASLKTQLLNGWLLCNLDVQSDSTGRQTLQFVYFLGSNQDGDGLRAGGTMNLATPQASQLGDIWGADLMRVLWDAVLDHIEAAVQHAADQKPGMPLTVTGFSCTTNAIQVAILAGDQ